MNYNFKFFVTMFVFFVGGVVSSHAQEKSISVDTKHELNKMEDKKDQLMVDYSWLEKMIDVKDCQGKSVSVFKMKKGDTKFVFIEENGKKVMYDESGKLYCTNSDELDCVKFYELTSTGDSWKCADTK